LAAVAATASAASAYSHISFVWRHRAWRAQPEVRVIKRVYIRFQRRLDRDVKDEDDEAEEDAVLERLARHAFYVMFCSSV
jgi:hypothetical protein